MSKNAQDPQKNIGAWAELQRARYNSILASHEYYHDLTTGSPNREPYTVACKSAAANIGRNDIANRYYGTTLIYNHEEYLPYLQDLGFGNDLRYENFAPGNGGTQLYVSAVKSLLKEDDVFLIPVPTYGYFLKLTTLTDTQVKPILLRAEDGFKLTPEYLDAEISRINEEFSIAGKALKASAFLHINPHNPTGIVYTKDDMEKLASVFQKHNLRLIIDDMVYAGLEYGQGVKSYEGKIAAPLASIDGMFDKTVTIFGLSKTYSLTALRAGLAVGPKHFIKPIRDYIGHEVEFVSHASQAAMSAVLGNFRPDEKKEYLTRQAEDFSFRLHTLSAMINGLEKDPSAQAYFSEQGLHSIDEIAAKTLPIEKPISPNRSFSLSEPRFEEWVCSELGEAEWKAIKESRDFDVILPFYKKFQQNEAGLQMEAREKLSQFLLHGLPGIQALPITESGFFMWVDVSELKGKFCEGLELKDGPNISESIMKIGRTSTLPGEATGYYGEGIYLRLSFSEPMREIVNGVEGISCFLNKVRDKSVDTAAISEDSRKMVADIDRELESPFNWAEHLSKRFGLFKGR